MRISAGIEKICAERLRQMTSKGHSLDADLSKHEPGSLLALALERVEQVCDLMTLKALDAVTGNLEDVNANLLAEAGALIAAEIDLILNKKLGVEANATIGGIWRA
jgi:hypothetical protein